jgi:hypothetical protein
MDVIVVPDDRIARPQLEKFYSGKPVEFMADEIALIAGKNAKHFDELQRRTWHTFLLRPEVMVLISAPLMPDSECHLFGNWQKTGCGT